MPRLWIDNCEVDVPPGGTLLDAARKLGIDVPALCYVDGLRPNTSCLVCVMKVNQRHEGTKARRHEGDLANTGWMVPSCATVAQEGMRVESETDEVRQVRKTTLELLLSDHAGECRAPCQFGCPFDSDVPRMVRQIAAGRIADAILTLRNDVPLPAVLARLGPDVCENGCRRGQADEAVAIGLLKRYVADRSLASPTAHGLTNKPDSAMRVAIVGAGPAGLSAAYFLLRMGHACTLFDAGQEPGGSLRAILEQQLPRAVLTAEIALIERLGARFELNATVRQPGVAAPPGSRTGRSLEELWREFDAVLLAVGRASGGGEPGISTMKVGLEVDRITHETRFPGVFAAGDVVRPRGQPVHAAVDGKAAAVCIDQYLRGVPITGRSKLFALGTGHPPKEEIAALMVDAAPAGRVVPASPIAGLNDEEARAEARRCLHCDCRKLDGCKLRRYAEMYGAEARRYRGVRRAVERVSTHPDIVYEPGKCILCGLCVQIAEQAREPLGLTFVGRGFDVKVAVPFDESLGEALRAAARRCVEACPTGALAWKTEPSCGVDQACAEDVRHGSADALEPKQ
jgi:ferredoxin